MLAILDTAVVSGLRGELVRVEVDVAPGLPGCQIVGLPDAPHDAGTLARRALKLFTLPSALHLAVNLASTVKQTTLATSSPPYSTYFASRRHYSTQR